MPNLRLLLVLVLGASAVSAACAHDWYTPLQNPQGQSCCGGTDCYPTELCTAPGERAGIMTREFGCMPIPRARVLATASPDGRNHVCVWGGEIRCVILGGQA